MATKRGTPGGRVTAGVWAIAGQTPAALRDPGVLDREPFTAWVGEAGGYQSVTLDDTSAWVLRAGTVEGRWIHIHPGRWTPHTRRARANVLKTAICVLAEAALTGDGDADPLDLDLVNRVRVQRLGLSPVKAVDEGEGLGRLLRDLLDVPPLPPIPPEEAGP